MLKTKRILIKGVVQGVGFRPFIYKLAREYKLYGYVLNNSKGVVVEVSGENSKIDEFIKKIKEKKPPQSVINEIKVNEIKYRRFKDFVIRKSKQEKINTTTIPVDLAICNDCIKDILDPSNRRYFYPFTNCTNCGPRFTIIKKIPYDRKYTTMNKFKMCSQCKSEYENPLDRRFHAQPNACPECGPDVYVKQSNNYIYGEKAIDYITDKLLSGEIVLVKGLGGFHIACDCFNKKAVIKLREFKKRPQKPFAVMVDEIDDIKDYVYVSDKEKEILYSYKSPIVMLKKKSLKYFEYVSPGLDTVGVMIAYTPLHKIIFKKLKERGFTNPLVMTSGNLRDEPIVKDNLEAEEKFKEFNILFHNRDIHNRIDDSVCFVDNTGSERIIRRARGYVPESIRMPFNSDKHILAAGGDIKSSFALLRDNEVFMSQYIGDLEEEDNRKFYTSTYKNMTDLLGIKPVVAVSDLHPNYYSAEIVKNFKIRKHFKLQHHIAHLFSVMAENNLFDNVIGVSMDGTGYGLDSNIWGGEFFVLKNGEIRRAGFIDYFLLPGGDLCVSQPWRTFASLFKNRKEFVYRFLKEKVSKRNIDIVFNMMEKGINSFNTSSMGRIFDAVGVLILNSVTQSYEGEIPMKLESLIAERKDTGYYKFDFIYGKNEVRIKTDSLVDGLIMDYEKKIPASVVSYRFHFGVVNMIKKIIEFLSDKYNIKDICFSGGVFQNKFLINNIQKLLSSDYNCYINRLVPSNDGGIALGQIYWYLLSEKYGITLR